MHRYGAILSQFLCKKLSNIILTDIFFAYPWCNKRYLKDGKSGMTIMEIGIFSGFAPDKDSLVEVNKLRAA